MDVKAFLFNAVLAVLLLVVMARDSRRAMQNKRTLEAVTRGRDAETNKESGRINCDRG